MWGPFLLEFLLGPRVVVSDFFTEIAITLITTQMFVLSTLIVSPTESEALSSVSLLVFPKTGIERYNSYFIAMVSGLELSVCRQALVTLTAHR